MGTNVAELMVLGLLVVVLSLRSRASVVSNTAIGLSSPHD